MRELDAELDLLVFGNKSRFMPLPWPDVNPPDFCRVDDEDTVKWVDDEWGGWYDVVPNYSTRWAAAELIYKAMTELVTNKTTPLWLSLSQFLPGKVYICRFEFALGQANTPEMAIALCAQNYYRKVIDYHGKCK